MESLTLEPGEVQAFFELLHGARVVSGFGKGDDSRHQTSALALERVVRLVKYEVVRPKVSWDEESIRALKATETHARVAFESRVSAIEAEARVSCDIRQSLESMATLETKMKLYLVSLENSQMDVGNTEREKRKREVDEELADTLEYMSTLQKTIKK